MDGQGGGYDSAPPKLAEQDVPNEQRKLVDQGNLSEAENLLKTWLGAHEAEPGSEQRKLELARVLFWRGKPSEARDRVHEIIEKDPQEMEAFSLLGQLEVRLG